MTINTVLIDDNVLARSGIEAIIAREPDLAVVGVAATADQACHIAAQLKPDLFIVGAPAVSQDTVETVRRLAGLGLPRGATLLLTSDPSGLQLDLLRLRCSIARSRGISAAQLLATIRVVATGYVLVDQRLAGRLAAAVSARHTDPDLRALARDLTKRQREVLELMTWGMSNEEIAQTLAVARSTVKSHVKDILGKLGLRSRMEAVIFANTGLAERAA